MTLVEAARRLTGRGFTPYSADLLDDDDAAIICELCDQPVTTASTPNGWIGHAPVCPWLSMPRIVAALEAAEAVLWATDAVDALPRSVVVALEDLEIALGEGQTSEVPA